MSFWDLANGRPTDLAPINDPSTAAAVAKNVGGIVGGGGLAVGGAYLFLAGLAPLWPAGLLVMRGLRQASYSAQSIPDTLTDIERARQKIASARRLQAVNFYERALKLDPENDVILSRVALTYACIGRQNDAIASIDRALSLCPKNPLYWLQKGTIALAGADLQTARSCFEKASELNPSDPEAWSNLGLVSEQMQDRATAQHCWEQVTNLSPESASGWINRGDLAYLLGNVAEGVQSWLRACAIDPSICPKWVVEYERGAMAFSKGEINSANASYDVAINLNPEYSQPWIGKALCSKRIGDLREGLCFLDKAIELDRRNSTVWFNRGNFLSELQQHAEAKDSWEQAFLIDPTIRVPWVVCFDEGVRLLAIGQAQAAVPHFYKATTLYAGFGEAWFRKGVAHRALGQTQEARQCWQQCLAVQGTHALAMLNLGTLEFESGNRPNALSLWEEALSVNSALSQAAINKGAALADAGHLVEAAKYFAKAASAGHPLANEALHLSNKYEAMDPVVGPRP